MFSKILVPLDGSKLAELALPYAEELAGAFNSEIDLVEVCEKKGCPERHVHQLYTGRIAELMTNNIKEAGSVATVKSLVLDGEPAARTERSSRCRPRGRDFSHLGSDR